MTSETPEFRLFGWESGFANYVSATAEDRASLVRRLGQAPAGRIELSIAGTPDTRNCDRTL